MKKTLIIIMTLLLLIQSACSAKTIHVVMETSRGKIVFELWPDIAPKGVENFAGLVNRKFYDGDCFERVETGLLLQFGALNGDLDYSTSIFNGKEFSNEVCEDVNFDQPYMIAYGNNGDDHSNGCQMFINLKPYPKWNMRYTIIGRIIAGQEVAAKIGECAVFDKYASDGYKYNVPVLKQKIYRIYVDKQ